MKNLCLPALLAALLMSGVVACSTGQPGETVAQKIDDATITADVKAAIRQEPALQVSEINVETNGGVVQLSGFVSSAANIAVASTVARSVNGVKSVRNDIRLK